MFKFKFTEEHLAQIMPLNKDVDDWYDAMYQLLPAYGIDTVPRVAGFIAQTAHESLDYTITEESLNYSEQRLNVIFPKYFKNAGRNASEYHRQEQKIANVVYANRMGNGDTASGDGWKYRGRGIMQLTGHNNYSKFAASKGMSAEQAVDYVATKKGALSSACWFWNSRRLNLVADKKDIKKMTRIVNGGYNGLDHREHIWDKALKLFTGGVVWTTVRLGSSGPTVMMVQQKLNIVADGIFGKGTRRAVMEWQRSNKLKVDGVIGENSLKTLLG